MLVSTICGESVDDGLRVTVREADFEMTVWDHRVVIHSIYRDSDLEKEFGYVYEPWPYTL